MPAPNHVMSSKTNAAGRMTNVLSTGTLLALAVSADILPCHLRGKEQRVTSSHVAHDFAALNELQAEHTDTPTRTRIG
jgi:hypothetical protein